jgi:hypothetical protein
MLEKLREAKESLRRELIANRKCISHEYKKDLIATIRMLNKVLYWWTGSNY